MSRAVIDGRLLLGVSAILQSILAVIYLIMQNTAATVTFQAWNGAVLFLGKVALGSGVCTIAAGVLQRDSGRRLLLVINGLALGALGLIQYALVRFQISLLTIALLITVMAVTNGVLDLEVGRHLRRERHLGDAAFWAAAGVAAFGFAAVFVVLALGVIRIKPGSHADLFWLGSYFALSAVCMLALGLQSDCAGSLRHSRLG